jgi:hypothetical protein
MDYFSASGFVHVVLLFCVTIVIVVGIVFDTNTEKWLAVLSMMAGYLLPSPVLRKKKYDASLQKQEHTALEAEHLDGEDSALEGAAVAPAIAARNTTKVHTIGKIMRETAPTAAILLVSGLLMLSFPLGLPSNSEPRHCQPWTAESFYEARSLVDGFAKNCNSSQRHGISLIDGTLTACRNRGKCVLGVHLFSQTASLFMYVPTWMRLVCQIPLVSKQLTGTDCTTKILLDGMNVTSCNSAVSFHLPHHKMFNFTASSWVELESHTASINAAILAKCA